MFKLSNHARDDLIRGGLCILYWDLHSTYVSLYVEYVFHQLNLLVTRSVVQIHASLLFICMTLQLSFFMHQIRCFCTLKCQHLSESEGRDDFDQRFTVLFTVKNHAGSLQFAQYDWHVINSVKFNLFLIATKQQRPCNDNFIHSNFWNVIEKPDVGEGQFGWLIFSMIIAVLQTKLCFSVNCSYLIPMGPLTWCRMGVFFGTPVSSTNKTDDNDINEILLKVTLNTINQTTDPFFNSEFS